MRQIYKKEFVKYDNGLPFKVFLCEVENVSFHWHKELELLYVLDGELKLDKGEQSYVIKSNELVVINRNEVHQFRKTYSSNLCIVIQIDLDFFKSMWPELLNILFDGNESVTTKGDFLQLKKIIYQILSVIRIEPYGYMIEIQGYICNVISLLLKTFDYKIRNWEEENEVDYARLGRILYYIDQNYMNKISLKEIASTEYLNEYYFSHFFKKKMGVSFQKYLKDVRVQKSHEMLIKSDKKIVDIAMENGFSNVQTFLNAFKDKYNTTPAKYRKNTIDEIELSKHSPIESKFKNVDLDQVLMILNELL